ncbi:MAG: hypothetical protein ACLTHQ_03435 [Odoribacter splanchnicus]
MGTKAYKDASGEKYTGTAMDRLLLDLMVQGIRRSEYAGFPGCRGAPPDY